MMEERKHNGVWWEVSSARSGGNVHGFSPHSTGQNSVKSCRCTQLWEVLGNLVETQIRFIVRAGPYWLYPLHLKQCLAYGKYLIKRKEGGRE